MKILKTLGLVVLVIFIVAQFFRPEKKSGELVAVENFIQDTRPPEGIKTILTSACFDCHSNATNYPWYNNITPINFWLKSHIEEGNKHLNFSKWASYSLKRKDLKLEELIEMVESKEMPLPSYTWTHRNANLSQDQIKAVVEWAKQVRMGFALRPQPQ